MGFEKLQKNTIWIIIAILTLTVVVGIAIFSIISRPGRDENQGDKTSSEYSIPETNGNEEDTSDVATPSLASPSEASPSGADWSYKDLMEQTLNLRRSYRPWWKSGCKDRYQTEQSEPELRPVDKSRIYIANDIHYYPSWMTDYGAAYMKQMDGDDGKNTREIGEILDTWIDSIIEERPATVILAGDNTLDGERDGSIELADKLHRLTEEGIQVLIIPGNHDINNHHAASYIGDEKNLVDTVYDADDFYNIFHEYGYDQAYSRDDASLSYLYKIDDKHWVMMLDSAVYEPENKVYGTIKDDTLVWMRQMLDEATEAGAYIVPVAHHNLLDQSRLYKSDCVLTNNQEVIDIMEEYHVPVWFSGHLHLQRIKTYLPEPGADKTTDRISEVITGSYSMYPLPYGSIKWDEDGDISYDTQYVDVSSDIVDDSYAEFNRVIGEQAAVQTGIIPEEMKDEIADKYATLLSAYVSGEMVDEDEFRTGKAYAYLTRIMTGTGLFDKIDEMLADCKKNNTHFEFDNTDNKEVK